jgi:hypothetical protein
MRSFVLCAVLLSAPLGGALAPVMAQAQTPAVSPAEAALRQTISDLQAGAPRYETMSPELADVVKAQAAAMTQLADLGAVKTVTRVGEGTEPYLFTVAFETGAVLKWAINFDSAGIINGLSVTQ